jgi:predicted NBD/HSP70 family sugar kinase
MEDNIKPYLLFDIGGTKTRIALSYGENSVDRVKIFETPKLFEKGIEKFVEASREVLGELKVKALVGGVAGPLNKDKSGLLTPPNLPDWRGKPLRKRLSDSFSCPVFLENDTALVGLGEATYGAGKGIETVSYITISTGVNGVKIVREKIDENYYGFEIGHQIVDLDNSMNFGSSKKGELEDFISGREVAKRFGKEPAKIDDSMLWDEISKYVAICVYNSILYWSTEAVILGGSMMGKISLENISNYLRKIMTIFPELPKIKKAELGELGGLYGALKLTSSTLFPSNISKEPG